MVIPKSIKNNKIFLFLFIVIIYNIVAKLWYLNDLGLWYDEAFSLQKSSLNFNEIIQVCQRDTNPPMYLFILKIWLQLFGFSIYSARVLSLVFFILSLLITFFTIKKFYSEKAAYVTLIILSLSNIHTEFAQEIRAFELSFFFVICSIYFFHRLLHQASYLNAFLLSLCFVLMSFSHYVTILFCFTQVIVYFVLGYFTKQNFKYFLFAGILSLMLFSPWALFVSQVINEQKSDFWLKKPGIPEYWNVLASLSHSRIVVILLLIFTLILPFIRKHFSKSEIKNYYTLFLFFFVPYILSIILSLVFPIFLDRYLLFTTFGIYTAIAYGISILNTNYKVNIILYGFIIALFIADVKLFIPREENWENAMKEFYKEKTENTLVIHYPSYRIMTFTFYYDKNIFLNYNNHKNLLAKDNIYEIDNLQQVKSIIQSKKFDKIIFFSTPQGNEIHQYLKQNFRDKKFTVHRRIWQNVYLNSSL